MSEDPLPPVCVLAGGLGTRLGALSRHTPKALVPVAGEPFALHQLRLLAAHGARRVVMCVGYLGDRVEREIGPERFGIRIDYSYDGPAPIGTLQAIRRAAPHLGPYFLVLYGDTYLRLDYRAAATAWLNSGLPALMTVLRNSGRWDSSNARMRRGLVTDYDKAAPTPEMRWIDYGLGGLKESVLDAVPADTSDLADLYRHLAREGCLFGYPVTRRFYEIGTPEALSETSAFLSAGGKAETPRSADRAREEAEQDAR